MPQSSAPFADSITITATVSAREGGGGFGYRRCRDGGRDRRPPSGPGGRPPAHPPRSRARAGRRRRQGDLALLAWHQLEPHPGAVERHRAQRSLPRRLRLVDTFDRRRRARRSGARTVFGALRLERARWRRPAGDPSRRRGWHAPRHGRFRGRLERLPARWRRRRPALRSPRRRPLRPPAARRGRGRQRLLRRRRGRPRARRRARRVRDPRCARALGGERRRHSLRLCRSAHATARAGLRDDLVRGAVRLDERVLARRRPGGDDRDRSRGERSRRPVRGEPLRGRARAGPPGRATELRRRPRGLRG